MFAKKTIARLKDEYDRQWEVLSYAIDAKTYISCATLPDESDHVGTSSDTLRGLHELSLYLSRQMTKTEAKLFPLHKLPWYMKIFIP